MITILYYSVATLLGLAFGLVLTPIFKVIPEKWLQDYGFNPKAANFRISKRMKFLPHGVIASLFCILCNVSFVLISRSSMDSGSWLRVAVFALAVPMFFLVLIADKLNRIIPDEFSIYIAALGILAIASDYVNGSIWFSPEAAWFAPLINHIGGAIIGGGLLWLIGFISETFFAREGIGQGDMRLLAACGLVCGIYGLVVIFYVSVISAAVIAIPLLVRKQIRLSNEENLIRSSSNPIEKRKEIEHSKEMIHFADDPDYLAFGPFLVVGATIFLVAEPWIYEKAHGLLDILGVLF